MVLRQMVGVSHTDISKSAQVLMQHWLGQRELCNEVGAEQGPHELGQVHIKCVWLDGSLVGGCRLD
jgi:hypothetical protein